MKVQDIQVGRSYHDGKAGVRKVVAIEGSPLRVRYTILAAKVEREMDRNYEYVSLIGQESNCDLDSFARWAKQGFDDVTVQPVLLRLKAAKLKLSPGEVAFLAGVSAKLADKAASPGSHVPYNHTEGRAVSGLEKKGVLRRSPGNMAELSELGAARLAISAV